MLSWFQSPVHRLETGRPLAVLPLTQDLGWQVERVVAERRRTIKADVDEVEEEEEEESENGGEGSDGNGGGQQGKQIRS